MIILWWGLFVLARLVQCVVPNDFCSTIFVVIEGLIILLYTNSLHSNSTVLK